MQGDRLRLQNYATIVERTMSNVILCKKRKKIKQNVLHQHQFKPPKQDIIEKRLSSNIQEIQILSTLICLKPDILKT